MSPNTHHNDTHSSSQNTVDPRVDIQALSLRPEEQLIAAIQVDIPPIPKPLPPLEALQLVTGVSRPEEIGQHGPALAARDFPEHEQVSEHRLYEVVFGRDSLITAQIVIDIFPELMHTTLVHLAKLQGVNENEMAEEEPGKIIHEARPPDDPIAVTLTQTRGWAWPYYGSVDATPLFVSAAAQYAKTYNRGFLEEEFVARDESTRTIRQALEAALAWLLHKMDQNPEGLMESLQMNKIGGNMIQSWKDSLDSHHHADGSLPNFSQGIASIEVQGYVFDALLSAAEIFPERAQQLQSRAEKLRALIVEKFWIADEQGSYFALGSDRDQDGTLRLLNVRTSNMGHLLTSQLLDGENLKEIRENLVTTLLSPALLSSRGIRTLATHENRYRPNSYHNGSVWPWDTYWISLGLVRHGYQNEAHDLRKRLKATVAAAGCYPEFVSGNDAAPLLPSRVIRVHDVVHNFDHSIEQPPQEIQAWTAASLTALEHQEKNHERLR